MNMEINSEINKVFGTEMAKLFASSISDEELNSKAKEIWKQLNSRTNEYGNRKTICFLFFRGGADSYCTCYVCG